MIKKYQYTTIMIDITLIHPIINHFTIALFTVSVVLDIIAKIFHKERLHYVAWVNLLLAGAATILTVISGLIAANTVSHDNQVHNLIQTHQSIGYFVLGCVLLLLIWRIVLKGKFPIKASILYMTIGLISLGFMFTTAYYGGEMVFRHGVAVKKISKDKKDHNHNEDHHHSHELSK